MTKKKQSLYVAVDLNGRREGVVLGIFNDLGTAKLYADNTAAHITIYKVDGTPVE